MLSFPRRLLCEKLAQPLISCLPLPGQNGLARCSNEWYEREKADEELLGDGKWRRCRLSIRRQHGVSVSHEHQFFRFACTFYSSILRSPFTP